MRINLQSADFRAGVDERGYLSEMTVLGQNVLKTESPLITLLAGKRAYSPIGVRADGARAGAHRIILEGGYEVGVRLESHPLCATLEILDVPDCADAVLFGPVFAAPDEVIGDVIGVVQAGDVALGMMSLNIKTLEGTPFLYNDVVRGRIPYEESDTRISVGGLPLCERAATGLAGGGAVLQLHCQRRTEEAYGTVMGVENAWIRPMNEDDPDAHIPGAKALLFGCRRGEALARIGQIEIEQGLPHPMLDGEWEKTSRQAMKSYLISEFSKDEVDMVLDKAQLAGMDTIYHAEPFETWGNFRWRPMLAESDGDFRRSVTDKAAARGMRVGLHTLTNFITTNDAMVSPVPSRELLKLTRLEALADMGRDDDSLRVRFNACLRAAQTLNAVQVDDEIFTYAQCREEGDACILTGLTRGAFGTVPAAHGAGAQMYLLRDYPYRTLFPELPLQDKMADRVAELFNATGAAQISFDGYEGCSYTGHGLYAPTRFLMRCYRAWDHFVLNDGSGLHHYGWHVSTRMNWGEPWGEAMRTGQVEQRIANQDFFRRNLFPRMLGWFLLRLADRRFEATTREDLEWSLSEAAGFDAGYSMTVAPTVMRRHGQIDLFMSLIREWDRLRMKNAFTEEQRALLRRPENEFRLEKRDDGHYTVYSIAISKTYTCALSEMQPGQPGGSDWSVENPMEESFAFRLRVEGDGEISDPMFKTTAGTVKFPCVVADGQYLLFDLDGTARVTDRNYKTLETVAPIGKALLPHGVSAVAFSCGHGRDDLPDVAVRFITRGEGFEVSLPDGE